MIYKLLRFWRHVTRQRQLDMCAVCRHVRAYHHGEYGCAHNVCVAPKQHEHRFVRVK